MVLSASKNVVFHTKCFSLPSLDHYKFLFFFCYNISPIQPICKQIWDMSCFFFRYISTFSHSWIIAHLEQKAECGPSTLKTSCTNYLYQRINQICHVAIIYPFSTPMPPIKRKNMYTWSIRCLVWTPLPPRS